MPVARLSDPLPDMRVRIVQLSDLHLYRDRRGVLAGVPTWATFHAVLDLVKRQQPDFDYLVLTGDLAQDEAKETYEMLRETLGDWMDRCRIIPGNHDDRGNIRAVFPGLFDSGTGPLTFVLRCEDWRVIGLDSHVPGETGGRIDRQQLQWLRAQLASARGCLVSLFVHHPPIPINVAWLDKLGLNDAAEFLDLVETSPQIRIICAGHVHQEFTGHIGQAALYTTPSTSVQFAARNEKTFDTAQAGYRTVVLEENNFRTEVHRLPLATIA
jgi:Icc protein